MRELTIPPAAIEDDNPVEMMRTWIADGAQWVSINPHLFRDRDFGEEEAWGLFLSDTIRHVANAISRRSGKDPTSVVEETRDRFLDEIKKPTSEVTGGYLEGDGD